MTTQVLAPPAVRSGWLVPAAAGIFAGTLVFDALPAALAGVGAWTWVCAAAGFGIMALSSRIGAAGRFGWAAWLASLGVWMHSLLEGVATGAGGELGMAAGALLVLGLVIHLVPESAALMALLTEAGVPARRALARCAVTWLLVGAGFFGAQRLIGSVPAEPLGTAMGLAAGTFAYLALVLWRRSSIRPAPAWMAAALGAVWVALLH